jgi:L-asparaginase/Glu-tRNA(Gln) amidotransferase subunit D
MIGTVRNNEVHFFYQSTHKHTTETEFNIDDITSLPLVEIVYIYQGCGDRLIRAAAELGARGIVSAGFGNGTIPMEIVDCYREWKKQGKDYPVLLRAARVPFGGTLGDYGHFDEEIGSIACNDLSPQKARVLLRLALSKTQDRKELCRIIATY